MIKHVCMSMIFVCIMSCVACSKKNKQNPQNIRVIHDPIISISDLKKFPVSGELGIPLGTPANIRAIIIDGDSMKDKIRSSSYLLQVTEVNGVKLSVMPIMEFSLDHAQDTGLAADNFQLYYIRNKKEADGLTSDQIAELKIGYVGKSVSLVVYETGKFSGVPRNLPDDAFLWQDEGFCFEPNLEVLVLWDTK